MNGLSQTNRPPDLEALQRMNIAALRELYLKQFGAGQLISNPAYLRRKLAWHMQAELEGGLPEAALRRALGIAREVELRIRASASVHGKREVGSGNVAVSSTIIPPEDSRLPMAGSLLIKEFKGRTIVVKVLDDGFEYEGRRYSSLSAVAREVTGTKWNGFLFFALGKEAAHGR